MPTGRTSPSQVPVLIISSARLEYISSDVHRDFFAAYKFIARLQVDDSIAASASTAPTWTHASTATTSSIAGTSMESILSTAASASMERTRASASLASRAFPAKAAATTPWHQKGEYRSDDPGSSEDEDAVVAPGTQQPSFSTITDRVRFDHSDMKRRDRASSGNLPCPFAVRNPKRYNDCRGIQLNTNAAVVRHLREHHRQPPYCPTCWATFKSDGERDGHIRLLECAMEKQIPIEGLNLRQARCLKRFMDNNDASAKTWDQIFCVVFPHVKRSRISRCRQGTPMTPPASPPARFRSLCRR